MNLPRLSLLTYTVSLMFPFLCILKTSFFGAIRIGQISHKSIGMYLGTDSLQRKSTLFILHNEISNKGLFLPDVKLRVPCEWLALSVNL
jgi:hypothetical protein